MWRFGLFCCISSVLSISGAGAQVKVGEYSYGSEKSCVSSAELTVEQCAVAASNAQAEFQAKAPRFATRQECERFFAATGCSLGFEGAEGWAGKKSHIYFSPREAGFRVVARAQNDVSVTPLSIGPEIRFSPRSALQKNLSVDFEGARKARNSWRAPSAAATGDGPDAVALPASAIQSSTKSLSTDPDFDCASVLEPNARDHAETACYPAPHYRR
jgi:hypothetical protein